ncbi:MAG: RNA-binding transcriptional accessory protein, partial [Muribaculaceae bacterium]|nr:RNA-binding transcriptional accessory protein [Muribaculaceae bacterium]
MTESISSAIARETGLSTKHVEATLALLADGATIPFISRYRKEATGGLDEVAIFNISKRADELGELAKRKSYILTTIDGQGNLTDELRQRINECTDINVLEDIYLPFKPKRRTRAQMAREKGLEPLAKTIMAQNLSAPSEAARRFLSDKVATVDEALQGASDIIAEWVNEHEEVRSRVRDQFHRFATISSKVVKGKEDEGENYANWFDFSQSLNRCGSHAYLALRRGEREGILRVGIDVDDQRTLARLLPLFVKRHAAPEVAEFITQAVADGYKRLTRPAIENEIAAEAKTKADSAAINTFAENLRQLLLSAPLGSKRILGVDPGFRTGCK